MLKKTFNYEDGTTKEIEYLDAMTHNVSGIKLGIWDRVKLLFGKPMRISMVHYTQGPHVYPHTFTSEGEITVTPFFKRKAIITGAGLSPEEQEGGGILSQHEKVEIHERMRYIDAHKTSETFDETEMFQARKYIHIKYTNPRGPGATVSILKHNLTPEELSAFIPEQKVSDSHKELFKLILKNGKCCISEEPFSDEFILCRLNLPAMELPFWGTLFSGFKVSDATSALAVIHPDTMERVGDRPEWKTKYAIRQAIRIHRHKIFFVPFETLRDNVKQYGFGKERPVVQPDPKPQPGEQKLEYLQFGFYPTTELHDDIDILEALKAQVPSLPNQTSTNIVDLSIRSSSVVDSGGLTVTQQYFSSMLIPGNTVFSIDLAESIISIQKEGRCAITGKPFNSRELGESTPIYVRVPNSPELKGLPRWCNITKKEYANDAIAVIHDSCIDSAGNIIGNIKEYITSWGGDVTYHPIQIHL